jgi:hypothetical protein
MIGPSSDFFDIKALIGTTMRSQVLTESKKRYFRCLLANFIRSVRESGSEVEYDMVGWA